MNFPTGGRCVCRTFFNRRCCPVAALSRLQLGARRWINSRSGNVVKLTTGAGFSTLIIVIKDNYLRMI